MNYYRIMTTKGRYVICAVFFAILLFNFVSCNFAPGSYPYVELYKFEVAESKIISAVNKFKMENSDYCLSNQERFIDGRRSNNDHWYHVWFYYPKENQIVKCWIRGTHIGCVGLGEYPSLRNYKEINKDFSKQENKIQKEKFERRILKEIQSKI